MSRTDKTTPWKVAESRGDCPRACGGGYPCKHFSSSGALKVYKDKGNGRARAKLRADLAKGVEPEPVRHRHTGLWDLA